MGVARHFLVVLFLGLALQAYGSSHSEAPGTAKKPSSDITDFYMFRSYEDTNKLILAMGILGLQQPFAGPNYYTLSDQHFFEFHLSCNNGNTDTDHMFQFYFGSSLGGDFGPHQDYDDYDYDCGCANDGFPTGDVRQGFELQIGTPQSQSVGIPLKVYGPVTDKTSAINWYDYYYLNYVTGYSYANGFSEATVTPIAPVGGDSTFRVPFAYVGTKTFGDSNAYETYAREFIYNTANIPWKGNQCSNTGIRTFVGPRLEPFSIDLGRTFDLVNYVPIPQGTANCYSNWDIQNLNTHYIVLEVPIACVECANNNNVIAGWAAVRELVHSSEGGHIPGQLTNRFGNALINELIIGIHEKSHWNYEHPENDEELFLTYYRYPTFPRILEILFTLGAPVVKSDQGGRADMDAVLNGGIPGLNRPANVKMCDMMRLNLATPVSTGDHNTDFNPYGVLGGDVAGYPNGRRFFDDVVDITLQVAMGALCRDEFSGFQFCANPDQDAPSRAIQFRDGSPISKSDFDDTFPFLRTPTPGSVPRTHPTHCSAASAVQVSSFFAFFLLVGLFFFI